MISRSLLCFIALCPLVQTSQEKCNSQLSPKIFGYFSAKHVKTVDAIMCSNKDSYEILTCFVNKFGTKGFQGLFRASQKFNVNNAAKDARSGIFMDISCETNQNQLRDIADKKWFTYNFIWLLWDPQDVIVKKNISLPLSIFSQVGQANWNSIIHLHKPVEALPSLSYEEGRFNEETDNFDWTVIDMNVNLQKSPVKAALMVIEDIYNQSSMLLKLQDEFYMPGKDVANRYIFAVTQHIAQLFNFSVELVISSDWGDPLGNGSWSGMMGLLEQSKADVTVSPLLPLSQRMDVSFPGIPSLPYWMAVVFKQPRALGTYRAMILELSLETWAVLGCLVIFSAAILSFTLKYGEELRAKPDASYVMGLLQSVGIMANQGLEYVPQGTSCRIVCTALLVVGLMVSTYYNAATMTALLSESPPIIKNLDYLVQSKIPFTAPDAPYIRISKARHRVFVNSVIDRLNNDLKICSVEEGIRSTLNGSAFVGDYLAVFDGINAQLKSHTICDLTIFNAGFHTNALSYMKKCPHFREMYLRGQLRSMEHGLLQKERKRWIAGRPTCARVNEFIYVKLEAVSVALGLLLSGIMMSLSFLILEILLKRKKKSVQNAS